MGDEARGVAEGHLSSDKYFFAKVECGFGIASIYHPISHQC